MKPKEGDEESPEPKDGKQEDEQPPEEQGDKGDKEPTGKEPLDQPEDEKGKPGEEQPDKEKSPKEGDKPAGMMRAGPMPPPGEMPLEEKGADAVDQFDQQEKGGEPEQQEQDKEGQPGSPQAQADAVSRIMEQWLNQIEGDPAQLLRNQFMLEEQRVIHREGGRLHESRPW